MARPQEVQYVCARRYVEAHLPAFIVEITTRDMSIQKVVIGIQRVQ